MITEKQVIEWAKDTDIALITGLAPVVHTHKALQAFAQLAFDAGAKSAGGEPVAWYIKEHGDIVDLEWGTQKPNTTLGDWKPFYTTPPAAAMSEPVSDTGIPASQPVALPIDLVIKALQAMDAEAKKRGERYPQTLSEQREDTKAVRNVIESLEFYGSKNQCRNGWPSITNWPALSNTPPAEKREPLEFEEIESCYPEDAHGTDDGWIAVSAQWLHDFARAIEAAHGIGVKK